MKIYENLRKHFDKYRPGGQVLQKQTIDLLGKKDFVHWMRHSWFK